MDFRISDTLTDSLAKLTGEEQKSGNTTAFDLQLNPANLGMSFHKLDKARDKNFCWVRVSSDLRLPTVAWREKASRSLQTPSTPSPQIQLVKYQPHDILQLAAEGARGLRLTQLHPPLRPEAHEAILFFFNSGHDLAFP